MFPHQLRILRSRTDTPLIGTQRTDGKFEFTVGQLEQERFTVLYDGFADLQDYLRKDDRTPEGSPDRMANGIIFLEDEGNVDAFQTDDIAEVTHASGRVETAVILEVRRLDGSLLVQRINQKVA